MSAEVPWVDGLTFAEMLALTAERHGERDALIFPQLGYRLTYRALHAEVRTVARALLALGVQRGEKVGIWATNWPQWAIVQLAAAHAGAVLVNINPAYRAHELRYVLNQADITTLFLTDRYRNTGSLEILAEVCPELEGCAPGALSAPACSRLRRVISIKDEKSPGLWSWQEFRALASTVPDEVLDRRQAEIRADDVVNIQYTSGTTGSPKGAMLTHRNLLMNAYYVGSRQALSERDRLCIPVPYYHCFGCVMGTLTCSIYGAAMVVPAETFDPGATLRALQDERCTALYGVPTMFIAELQHPSFGQVDVSTLRTGVMAGSPCPIEVMRAVIDKMGAREITIAYGLTEASPVITQTDTSDDLEHRVGTVGRPLPDVEVKIVGPDSLAPLPFGRQGELMARSHGVMKGYYNKPEETAQVLLPDGWLRSGDLAIQNPDGYYRITGRIKDMIIRGGENIYPREIEEFLYAHPAVADVQVVGLPDERRGEEVCAWIRLREGQTATAEEIQGFCRSCIAHFKVPRYIVFVDEYPTTVTGKIQKFKLREMGIERFGLQKAAAIETA
jgi:fatty-acyl-CoA synthase